MIETESLVNRSYFIFDTKSRNSKFHLLILLRAYFILFFFLLI